MENENLPKITNILYKFSSVDKEISTKVKCLLKECHTLAKYSISFLKANGNNENQLGKFKTFICSKHLEHWSTVKTNLLNNIIND